MTWTFTPGAPADARRALPVFTFTPNWSGGVLERLSWATDVMSSEQEVEQRRSTRLWPRRTFEAGFLRTRQQRARLDLFLAGTGKGLHLVPLWHEQFRIGAPIAGADLSNGTPIQFPAGTLKKREFAAGDLVLLMLKDPATYSVLSVMTVNLATDRITVRSDGNIGTWDDESRITPLRRARILDAPTIDNPTDRVGTAQIRFDLVDADSRFTPSWGYCSPLFRYKPDRITPLKVTYNRDAYTIDFGGAMDVTDLSDRAQIATSMALKLFGRDAVYDFRSFLYMARGQAVRFYVPSFTEDLVLAEDIPYGLTFKAKVNGFTEYMPTPQESRRIVSFEFNDGRPTVYRNVVGVQAVLSTVAPFRAVAEQFTVETDLPPILMNDVSRISFIVPSRFDQDSMELFHYVDDSAAVGASVAVTSEIVEGMPPIECWVTSRPYPLVSEEFMTSDAALVLGRMYEPSQSVTEEMTSGAALVSGVMRSLLYRYSDEITEMTSDAVLTAGVLRQILKSYDRLLPDEVISQAKLNSGTLRAALIRYSLDPDSLSVNATLKGGTLS